MPPENQLPSPWREFLTEIDGMLNEELVLHCVGGFVVACFNGSGRTTGDLDYYTAVPANFNLPAMTGDGSKLHKKYGVYLQKAAVMTLPEEYEARLIEMAKGCFKRLRLLVLDPYDCILSKLERNGEVDVDDAEFLFRSQNLDAHTLRQRYDKEFRPYAIGDVARHDTSLKLWLDIFTASPIPPPPPPAHPPA
jgi:Nucleotidyltransferase of unknown function (DUF6036)